MRAARRRQCFCRRVIYVWLQNIWRDAGGGGRNDTSVYKAAHFCSLSLMFSRSSLYLSVFTFSLSLCTVDVDLFFFFLICVIPELLLERQLAVWCSSLLIINASSQRELHKACQPIRSGFISCTTLFLRTPAQGRAGDPRKSQRRDQLHALRQFQRIKISMGSKMLQRWMEGFNLYIYIMVYAENMWFTVS